MSGARTAQGIFINSGVSYLKTAVPITFLPLLFASGAPRQLVMKCLFPWLSFLCSGYGPAVILDVLPHEKAAKEKRTLIQRSLKKQLSLF